MKSVKGTINEALAQVANYNKKQQPVVEGYDKAAVSAAVRKAAEKENMKSKRDVERFFDYDGGDIIFRMVKDEDEANVLMSQLKSQYKQKFKEAVDEAETLDERETDKYGNAKLSDADKDKIGKLRQKIKDHEILADRLRDEISQIKKAAGVDH